MTVKVTKPALNLREELSSLKKPSGIAGEAMLRAETPQEQFNLIGAGRRNLIINGGMDIWQRGTSSSLNGFLADRFKVYHSTAGGLLTERSTDVPDAGFSYSLKVSCTATATPAVGQEAFIEQRIESQNLRPLNYGYPTPRTATLSFWVKSNVVGEAGFYIYQTSATQAYQARYTIHQADTWEKKTITIQGNTTAAFAKTAGTGFEMRWYLSSNAVNTGSDYLNAWVSNTTNRTPDGYNFMSSTSNVMRITGVQLELGSVATPFEHRSYGEELALCQRYYEIAIAASGGRYSDGLVMVGWTYATEKRAVPSVVLEHLGGDTPSAIYNYGQYRQGGACYGTYGISTNRNATFKITADAEL